MQSALRRAPPVTSRTKWTRRVSQAFSTFEDMTEFRNWCFSAEGYDFAARCTDPHACAHREAFARKHKNVVRRWEVSSEFPSRAVVEAYLKPAVDRSDEAFEWGEPQVERIVRWARERLNWDERYTADVLKPVSKRAPLPLPPVLTGHVSSLLPY